MQELLKAIAPNRWGTLTEEEARLADIVTDALFEADRVTDWELVNVDCYALQEHDNGWRDEHELAYHVLNAKSEHLENIVRRYAAERLNTECQRTALAFGYASYFRYMFV